MTADHARNAVHYSEQLAREELERLLKVARQYCYTPWELIASPGQIARLRSAVDRASAAVDNAKRADKSKANHPAALFTGHPPAMSALSEIDDIYAEQVADYHLRMQELRAEKQRYDKTMADWDGGCETGPA